MQDFITVRFETAQVWIKLFKLFLPRCHLEQLSQMLKVSWCHAGLFHPSLSAHTPLSPHLGAKLHSSVWARKVHMYGCSSSCYIILIEGKKKEKRRKGNSVSDPCFCEDTIRNMIQEHWLNAVCSYLEMSGSMNCHMIFTHFYSLSPLI